MADFITIWWIIIWRFRQWRNNTPTSPTNHANKHKFIRTRRHRWRKCNYRSNQTSHDKQHQQQILHDSCEHTFIQCKRAEEVWEKILPLIKKTNYIIRKRSPNFTVPSFLLGYPHSTRTVVVNSFISATIYSIWQARIKLKWDTKFAPPFVIAKKAIAITRDVINSHFEIAKRKSNDDLRNFKLRFEEPLLFTIDITTQKIDFKF